MHNRTKIYLTALFIMLSACNFFSKYEGYKRTMHGIHYKLLSIGDDTQKAVPGDFITIDLAYKTINDSVFFMGRRKFQLTAPEYNGSVDECFAMLAQGEKAEFIINAQNFFKQTLQTDLPKFINPDADIKIVAAMSEIQTIEQYNKEKEAFLHWIEDFGEYEQVILKQFMQDNKLAIPSSKSGMYYLTLKQGAGPQVKNGDTVVIDYEGKFLNGKFFDSTIKRHEAFSFVYGTEWQVVPGLEEAIGKMHEGEKALVILPSDLAFGQGGSSTGIVPPFTSLIFEVELKKLN
jgi:FKBP-type peptidyl-prolyl cis-trans isomerase